MEIPLGCQTQDHSCLNYQGYLGKPLQLGYNSPTCRLLLKAAPQIQLRCYSCQLTPTPVTL